MMLKVPYHRQSTGFTCGPAAIRMVLAYWGQRVSEKRLRSLLGTRHQTGTRRVRMAASLRGFGLRAEAKCGATAADLRRALAAGRPVIVNYREPEEGVSHYAVVVGLRDGRLVLNDPDIGPGFRIGLKEFLGRWYGMHRGRHARWLLVASPRRK